MTECPGEHIDDSYTRDASHLLAANCVHVTTLRFLSLTREKQFTLTPDFTHLDGAFSMPLLVSCIYTLII
jgi:hypothetical protein